MSELLNIVVLEYKVCSLQYFLDEMTLYELNWILPSIELSNKMNLEQTRFLAYITAQCQSTKKLKITDIMQFSWDEKDKPETQAPIQNDIERLKKKALKIIEEKNNNSGRTIS